MHTMCVRGRAVYINSNFQADSVFVALMLPESELEILENNTG